MRLKLHNRMGDSYAKLQVCLCVKIASSKVLVRASNRGCGKSWKVVLLVTDAGNWGECWRGMVERGRMVNESVGKNPKYFNQL
jgi:hypothetical protein